ncbi:MULTISPECIES: IclR family transcriptional regulator [Bacillus cereus group]|uniref:IclR family transcriptional regulator n=1 Tax=Bacillus cereus TaxID=1396 RepID=A0AA44Q701_BACCE|nr:MULTISPECIES: IclR family transcriptional regulator [Bacillus cereus group]EEL50930.1 Transcriptional regulator, IclR [Bacillus cereus Rock3-44]PFA24461.1 IclR family transcriptional regulator [Bacillus cereus]PFN02195.1 IclR family transcriptional regulator [Bacillus cereus]PFO84219.1 IclR family transcriptional regulator [Bacillus cereus]PFR32853.1 IclR family transcriptional regulator [Bacillus cereus]
MIASISKICKILNCFTSGEPVLGNSEIAAKLNMNPSTVHHLVRTLCEEGMLIQDEQRKYRLGWKLLEWGNQVMFQQEIYSGAIPIVEELVKKFNGTVHIGMFDRGDVVFILKVSSKDSVQISTHVGSRKPAYCTSTGKVLLSFNPSSLEYTSEHALLPRAPNTITCMKKFQEELQTIRKQGYSVSDNENEHGLYGIAAPIRSYTGRTIAALNIVGPKTYMQGSNRQVMIRSVMHTANLISKEFGYLDI